ncbi:hypothetical protein QBC34DRAFT_497658 [Podospora aff. communis PSN243]|uniref:Protein kinase domain-containing protein n=1 Tax=Podospora aff. communis PSN243 TaxID=3040156 RepID=A0AAV9G9F9_9PEZI|nr:hypothetical protein QBC34DRAFT_497658 [Podospora aff. communis PSN243]
MDQAQFRFYGLTPREMRPTTAGRRDMYLDIYDGETRRFFDVAITGIEDDQIARFSGEGCVAGWAPFLSTLSRGIDSGRLGPDVTAVEMDFADAKLVSVSRDANADITPYVPYASPDAYQLPCDVKTVARDQLVELGRLAPRVDAVAILDEAKSPKKTKKSVFKYYLDTDCIPKVWMEVQYLARLAAHPNVIPLEHLVTAPQGPNGEHRVVGFTVPFFAGGSLATSRATRTFKLKWVKQLCRVVDHLNLKHGICHDDLDARNVAVDPVTDNLVLLDFGDALRRGKFRKYGQYIPPAFQPPPLPQDMDFAHLFTQTSSPQTEDPNPGAEEEAGDLHMASNSDVSRAILMVHDLVTRDAAGYAEWETSPGVSKQLRGWGVEALLHHQVPWVAHPSSLLDHPADDYRLVLVDWLAARRANPIHHDADDTRVPDPLIFPDHMPMPGPDEMQDLFDPSVLPGRFLRRAAVRAGRTVVDWVRPPTPALDRSRTLLATGAYLDDHDAQGPDVVQETPSNPTTDGEAKTESRAKEPTKSKTRKQRATLSSPGRRPLTRAAAARLSREDGRC